MLDLALLVAIVIGFTFLVHELLFATVTTEPENPYELIDNRPRQLVRMMYFYDGRVYAYLQDMLIDEDGEVRIRIDVQEVIDQLVDTEPTYTPSPAPGKIIWRDLEPDVHPDDFECWDDEETSPENCPMNQCGDCWCKPREHIGSISKEDLELFLSRIAKEGASSNEKNQA